MSDLYHFFSSFDNDNMCNQSEYYENYVKFLCTQYAFDPFFDDDTFAWGEKRVLEICEKFKKQINLIWSCTAWAHTGYETLKAMKEAGCRLLIVGFESGDPAVLKNIEKGATVEQAVTFMKNCKKLGILVHGDYIFGLPGETRETIERTMKFAQKTRL